MGNLEKCMEADDLVNGGIRKAGRPRPAFATMSGESRGFHLLITTLIALSVVGLICFMISYIRGHQDLGSNNVIPWGMPIIVAIYLIGVSAGLHILAFFIYILGRKEWKPIMRMAVYLAIVLISGAMISLALDLGRPEKMWRLFVFSYLSNMNSMFAVNAIIYPCYLLADLIYLIALICEKEKLSRLMGMMAFGWAVLTHAGTGLIFGLVAARESWFSPLKPLEFVIVAFTSSLALLVVVIVITFKLTRRHLRPEWIISLGKLIVIFLVGLILLIWIEELPRLYLFNPQGKEALIFMLTGRYSWVFWVFQVFLGEVVPLSVLLHPRLRKTIRGVFTAALLIVIGVFFERLYLVIPGLAYPQSYALGKIEGLYGAVGSFPFTVVESLMSLGIFALLALFFILGLKHLELLPTDASGEQRSIVTG